MTSIIMPTFFQILQNALSSCQSPLEVFGMTYRQPEVCLAGELVKPPIVLLFPEQAICRNKIESVNQSHSVISFVLGIRSNYP